jgi:hypothetical protein
VFDVDFTTMMLGFQLQWRTLCAWCSVSYIT